MTQAAALVGKTAAVSHLALHAMKQGARVCVFSGEMRTRRLLKWMTRQATAMFDPSIQYIRTVHRWYADKLWMFELVGTAKTDRLLEVFRYTRKRYGVSVFVVDSLLKCGIAEPKATST